jgi:1,4-dihydroxy-2-naphthoate octaprenyltransferase
MVQEAPRAESPTVSAAAVAPGEPTPDRFRNPAVRLFAATRPAFLAVTGVGVLVGLATAEYDLGRVDPVSAVLTLLFALVAHAGVNVLNDYFDSLGGTDERNASRIFPFTGGSRFIQNGVLALADTRRLGYLLLALVVPAGLLLSWWSGPGLMVIGLAGLVIGWAYSAPPLKLNSRGLGEACVAVGFLCVVLGADYVQRHAFASTPFSAGLPYALMVTNVLFINQFPDRKADLETGKLHWVARLAPERACWGYPLIALTAALLLGSAVLVCGSLPSGALLALAALLQTGFACRELMRYASTPSQLRPAIKATIGAALVHGMILSGAMLFS